MKIHPKFVLANEGSRLPTLLIVDYYGVELFGENLPWEEIDGLISLLQKAKEIRSQTEERDE